MANKLSLFVVDTDKSVVQSPTNGGAATIPPLTQGDVTPIELTLLTRNNAGGFTSPFSVVRDQQVCKIAIGTPSATVPTVIAIGTLAYVASAGTYNGSLSMATQQVATFLGSSISQPATFEIQVVSGNSGIFTVAKPCTVQADLIKEGGVVTLVGSQSFYDSSQVDALFLGKNRTDTITSATTINVNSSAGQVKFVRDDAKTYSFGSNVSPGIWSDNDDTLARRGDVVLKSGGTYTGEPHFASNPIHPNALTRKGYVDLFVPLSGGTLSGDVHAPGTDEHPKALATVQYVLAHASTPQIDSTLSFAGSILGVNATTTGSLVGYTHRHVTAQVAEESGPLYFTAQRVRDVALTGVDVVTQGAVTASDTVLSAIGKLEATMVSTSGGTFSSAPGFPLGSAAGPAVAPTLDSNTGIYFTGVDTVAIALGGAEAARFTNSGLVIGSTSAAGKLTVVGTANQVQLAIAAHSSQTSNLVEWYDSASALAGRITRYGGLAISTDGVSAADVKGVRITASSSSGAAGVEFLNNLGGSASSIRLLGSGGSPANALVIENAAAADVCLRADGIDLVRVREAGNVELTRPVVMASGASGVEGGLWQNATTKTIDALASGVEQSLPGVLFVNTANTTVGSTSSETTAIPAGSGTLNLPAGFFVAGKCLRIRLLGTMRTKSSAVGTFTLRVKYGSGNTLIGTGGFTPGTSLSDAISRMDLLLTCRTSGASGVVTGFGSLEIFDQPTLAMKHYSLTQAGSGAIDTTVGATLDITVQWQTSDAANVWTTRDVTIEVL